MRILTVRQPWAWAIIHGQKDVENRTRNIAGDWRGPVAIHAGAREDTSARQHPEIQRLARDVWWTTPDNLLTGRLDQFGHIVGVVDLVGVHMAAPDNLGRIRCQPANRAPGEWNLACSPWALANYHLELANPRPLAEPIPYKGALGLRELPDDVAAQVLAGVAS